MRVATDRADGTDRRTPDSRRQTGIRAAAAEFARNGQSQIPGSSGIGGKQRFAFDGLGKRHELAGDFDAGRRAGHGRGIDDRLNGSQDWTAIRRLDVPEIDPAFRVRCRGVDRLPTRDEADVQRDATLQIRQCVDGDDLVRQLADGRDALFEIAAGMGCFSEHLETQKDAALAAGDHVARRPPRLGIEDATRLAGDALDHRPRGGRGYLLVRGDEACQRRGRTAEFLEGLQHEGVHHETGLHIGDAWAVGTAVLDAKPPFFCLALGKNGVAMSHQQNGFLVRRRIVEPDVNGVAIGFVRLDAREKASFLIVANETITDGIDAGLVIGAAVDVHHLFDQPQHLPGVGCKPVADLFFGRSQARIATAHPAGSAFAPQSSLIKRDTSGQVQFQRNRCALEHFIPRSERLRSNRNVDGWRRSCDKWCAPDVSVELGVPGRRFFSDRGRGHSHALAGSKQRN